MLSRDRAPWLARSLTRSLVRSPSHLDGEHSENVAAIRAAGERARESKTSQKSNRVTPEKPTHSVEVKDGRLFVVESRQCE